MRPEASAARIMPTIMSSKGRPYSPHASCNGLPASTRSIRKSKMTSCFRPAACLRTVTKACMRGSPASTAVAISRMRFASSSRGIFGPLPDSSFALLVSEFCLLCVDCSLMGTFPSSCSFFMASDWLAAVTVPDTFRPSLSSPS